MAKTARTRSTKNNNDDNNINPLRTQPIFSSRRSPIFQIWRIYVTLCGNNFRKLLLIQVNLRQFFRDALYFMLVVNFGS